MVAMTVTSLILFLIGLTSFLVCISEKFYEGKYGGQQFKLWSFSVLNFVSSIWFFLVMIVNAKNIMLPEETMTVIETMKIISAIGLLIGTIAYIVSESEKFSESKYGKHRYNLWAFSIITFILIGWLFLATIVFL